jgi:hypothetical protein
MLGSVIYFSVAVPGRNVLVYSRGGEVVQVEEGLCNVQGCLHSVLLSEAEQTRSCNISTK